MLQIVLLVIISLLYTRITSNGTDIDHAVSELNECASLYWYIEIRNVMKNPLDQVLVFWLAQPINKGGCSKWYTELEGSQSVFWEAEVEEVCDGNISRS